MLCAGSNCDTAIESITAEIHLGQYGAIVVAARHHKPSQANSVGVIFIIAMNARCY